MITKFKLFELSDNLVLPDGSETSFKDPSTLPFYYFKDELWIGDWGESHGSITRKIMDFLGDKLNNVGEIWDHVEHQGRLFFRDKVISFWNIPNRIKFTEIVNELEKKTDMDIWNTGFKLELVRGSSISKDEFDKFTDYKNLDDNERLWGETKFIPIEEYKFVQTKSKKSLGYKLAVNSGD